MTTQNWRRFVGALVIAAGAAAVSIPAAAQVYYWSDRPSAPGYYQQPQQRDFFSFPFSGGERRAPVVDYSKAPAPRKLETPPTSTVVVVGDSMADWLGYGLDETYADQPDTGVVREIRATAGLIRYDPKNEQLDWPAVIKDQLATEKPNVIIVMLGLNDRISIRDGAPAKDADQTNQDKSAQEKAAQEKAAQEKRQEKKKSRRRPQPPQPHHSPLPRTARRSIRSPAAPTISTPICGRSFTSNASTP